MCGIAGLISSDPRLTVEPMVESLWHRGPDDRGVWKSPDGFVQLGHTRLSVLDPSPAGHQPMVTPEGDVAITYNGELYNYPEIGDQLQKSGIVSRSDCDTEAVLNTYMQKGTRGFRDLDGMFALAIYDGGTRTLVLARDRLGKKPLYWCYRNGIFGFASEIKALRCVPELDLQIEPKSILAYLQFDYVPTPRSIYEGVNKLMPGHYLVFRNGKVYVEPFWSLDQDRRFEGSYEDALREMDSALEQSVKKRFLSDVPLGVFLSGGLDSSTIAYYAAQHQHRIKTFSIGFEDPTYDESGFACKVASDLDTDHQTWVVTADDLIESMQNNRTIIDEPLGDTSIIPTYMLASHTRESVTVALGGDGGDELFAGYPTFQADAFARSLGWIPGGIWHTAEKLLDRLVRPSSGYLSRNFLAKQFVRGMQLAPRYRHQQWLGSFSMGVAKFVLHPDIWEDAESDSPYSDLQVWQPELSGWDSANGKLYEYLRTYLMDEVMVKVDRATMAVSLEARSPFLDPNVVELAFSLPYDWKFHKGKGKRILKDIMRDRLPDQIIDRKKKGFGMPIASWLRSELSEWGREQLHYLTKTAYFSPEITSLHDRHLSGKEDLRKPLWNLIAFSQFLQQIEDRVPLTAI